MLSTYSKGSHMVEFLFLYHSLVGLIIEREKFINLNILQREYNMTGISLTVDEMIEHSKDKHSRSCLMCPTGNFIIPPNRVLGKSHHHRVLGHLKDEKTKKKKRKRDGKQHMKVADNGDSGESRKNPPEDANEGDDQDGECGNNTC